MCTVLCRFLVTYWRTLPMVTFPQCSSSICVDMCTICVNSAFFQMRLIDSWKLLESCPSRTTVCWKIRDCREPPSWQREGRHFKATRIQKTTKACCIILFSTSGFDFIYFIFFRTHCSLQMLSGSLFFSFSFFFFLSGGCQHIVMTAPVSIHHSGCFENEAALSQCSFWS